MRAMTELADGVWVTTSRRELTTSTVLVNGDRALLIDPGWEPDELAALADWLDHHALRVVGGFATHAHYDHLLWHPRFGNAPRWSSTATANAAAENRAELVNSLGPDWPAELAPLVGRLAPTTHLDWPGVELITHDAHIAGHTALWLTDLEVLIAGDMLSDIEIPLLENSSAAEYLAGLELLRTVARRAQLIIPGHGHPGSDGAHRWQADHDYLQDPANSTDQRLASPLMAAAHQQNLSGLRRSLRPRLER